MSFPTAPMRSLLDEAHKAALPKGDEEVWALNLDQIESHSGKVLAKVMLNRSEVGPSTYVFNRGTVLYCKLRPYLNKVVVADDDGVATTELVPLRCDESKVLPQYLAHFLRSATFLAFATNVVAGAKMPRMVMSEFWSYPVPLPPLEEQRRIAAILDQAETLRTQRRTALALLDSLTQSLFLDLLEYAGSDVKRIAVEDAMDAIIDYRGKTPEKTTQGVPLVTAKVVKNGELLKPDEFIAEDAYDDWMQRGFPETGDVLFTTEAPLGEVAQLDGRKVALAQRLLVLRGKHGLLQNTFLRFALTSWEVRRQIEARATGSTVKGIRQKELRQVELPIPPFALQQTFATRIASIEALKATHRRALAALDALFASLQQRAFAGQL